MPAPLGSVSSGSVEPPALAAWLELGSTPLRPIARCACCPAPGTSALRLASLGLLVPLCAACREHVAQARTHRLAALLASLLLGASCAATTPLVVPAWPWWSSALSGALAAGLPLALWWWLRRAPALGHAAAAECAALARDGRLVCLDPSFGLALAAANDLPVRLAPAPSWLLPRWLGVGVLLSGALGLGLGHLHQPETRVLNLTTESWTLEVDGRPLATLLPSRVESSAAGAALRLPAGRHHLLARARGGAVVAEARVELRGGARYLYAPAAPEICFWLEERTQGSGAAAAPSITPLRSDTGLHELPSELDRWFSPLPAGSSPLLGSSGGRLRALRQARCLELEPAVAKAFGRD